MGFQKETLIYSRVSKHINILIMLQLIHLLLATKYLLMINTMLSFCAVSFDSIECYPLTLLCKIRPCFFPHLHFSFQQFFFSYLFCSIFCSLSSNFLVIKRFFLVYLQLLSMHDCCIRVIYNMVHCSRVSRSFNCFSRSIC